MESGSLTNDEPVYYRSICDTPNNQSNSFPFQARLLIKSIYVEGRHPTSETGDFIEGLPNAGKSSVHQAFWEDAGLDPELHADDARSDDQG